MNECAFFFIFHLYFFVDGSKQRRRMCVRRINIGCKWVCVASRSTWFSTAISRCWFIILWPVFSAGIPSLSLSLSSKAWRCAMKLCLLLSLFFVVVVSWDSTKFSTAQRCSTLSALMAVRSFIFLIKNCSSLLLLLLLMMLGSTHPVGRPLSAAFPPIFQPFRNEKKKNNLIAWPSFIAVVDVCGCCRCPTFW